MLRSTGSCYAGAQSGLVAALSGDGVSATKLFAATSLASQVAGISGSFLFTKLYELGLGMHNDFGNALPYVVASVSCKQSDCDSDPFASNLSPKPTLTEVVLEGTFRHVGHPGTHDNKTSKTASDLEHNSVSLFIACLRRIRYPVSDAVAKERGSATDKEKLSAMIQDDRRLA